MAATLTKNVDKINRPELDSSKWTELKSGLWVWDVKVGDGAAPKKRGAEVKVHYSGWFADDDVTILDSSIKRGEPVEFPLGEVIDGWKEGIAGMKVGGVRHLYVPAKLAYGDKTKDETGIKAGSDLVFTVELLEVK